MAFSQFLNFKQIYNSFYVIQKFLLYFTGMVVQEDQDNNTYADERGLGGPDDMDQAQADRALAAQAMVDQANAGLAQARAAQAAQAQAAEAAINEDYDNISQDDDNQEIDPGC